ncbi:MAG: tetratricopeptide repeat protein [Xanthobacteraceae bacterium]
MKCILCKICESANAAVQNSTLAWMDTQINKMALWEQEADQERILHADGLQETDPAQSFNEYLALAEQGSVWSMVPVGIDFETGRGVPQNLQQAEAWYRRAYERGSDYGLLELGRLYRQSKRFAEAEAVLRTGVERGLAPAMLPLAWCYLMSAHWRQKREETLTLLERASSAGDLSARRFLGTAMARGWFGLSRIPSGFKLSSRVAEEVVKLIDVDVTVAPRHGKPLGGFFGRFAQRWSLVVARAPAL